MAAGTEPGEDFEGRRCSLPGRGLGKAIAELRQGRTPLPPAPRRKTPMMRSGNMPVLTSTELARNGKLDPVIGRDEEIRRTIQVLSRRTKNNPVLIGGEPGVGKTAIAEGLSLRIVQPAIVRFESLRDKKPDGAGRGLSDRRGEIPRRVRGTSKAVLSEVTGAAWAIDHHFHR